MKTIIYIVLGVGWYLFKAYQKKSKKEQQQQVSQAESVPETNYEYTSPKEEVLPQKTQSQYDQPKDFEDLFSELIDKKESNELITATIEAKEEGKIKIPKTIEGGIPHDDFKRFKEFEVVEEEESSYLDLLQDSDAAKRAFVASEIFNRKY